MAALRKYDGERERGLVGAVVVKPTYTQFIQHFQLTLIIEMDESTRFLHLSKFKVGRFTLELYGSVSMSIRPIRDRIVLQHLVFLQRE